MNVYVGVKDEDECVRGIRRRIAGMWKGMEERLEVILFSLLLRIL
jgi:hypothetical protein